MSSISPFSTSVSNLTYFSFVSLDASVQHTYSADGQITDKLNLIT
jgi:hypothetical protein